MGTSGDSDLLIVAVLFVVGITPTRCDFRGVVCTCREGEGYSEGRPFVPSIRYLMEGSLTADQALQACSTPPHNLSSPEPVTEELLSPPVHTTLQVVVLTQ